jgi:putative tryptophan/tyrosine transport system substrate-binding protein
MKRRAFVSGLGVILTAPLTAEAQPGGSLRVIGFFGPPPSAGGLVQAFQEGLRSLGYVEGRNVKIEYRYTDQALQGHPELFARYAAELVQLKPEIIVVSVTEAALAVKKATATIPIVTVSVPDPVEAGLVASLARPGGNVTGLSRETRDLIGKSMQLLKETLPQETRIGILVNAADPLKPAMVADVERRARSLGVQVRVVEATVPTGLDAAFSAMRADKVGALVVLGGSAFYLDRRHIADLALENRLPSVFQNREFAEAGGLLSYAPSTTDNYRRAAFFVDKILQGARPADLPVEQPTRFELVINLKTAKALGLTIPPSLLLRADQVIE